MPYGTWRGSRYASVKISDSQQERDFPPAGIAACARVGQGGAQAIQAQTTSVLCTCALLEALWQKKSYYLFTQDKEMLSMQGPCVLPKDRHGKPAPLRR
jgi:hypothetical protein